MNQHTHIKTHHCEAQLPNCRTHKAKPLKQKIAGTIFHEVRARSTNTVEAVSYPVLNSYISAAALYCRVVRSSIIAMTLYLWATNRTPTELLAKR